MPPAPPHDRRRLGTAHLAALVVANMIGAGVFTSSGFALADLGSPGWVLAAWAVGGVLAVLGAVSYGALAAHLRESGGEYLFLSRAVHPFAGFLAGWVSLWAGFTGAIALAAQALSTYLAPWLPSAVPADVVGTLAIVGAGVLHTGGIERGARVQTALVALKLVALAAFVAFGAARVSQADAATPAPSTAFALGPFAVSLMWISLSYSGWNAGVYVAGEARDPERTVPRALLLGTLVTTALYLGLNAVFVYAAPVDELAGRPDVAAAAARAIGGTAMETAVRVVIATALLTSVSSMVMIGPRVYAKMADDGVFPRAFAFTGATPRGATWLQVVLAVVVLWASDLREQLTNLGWLLGIFTALAVLGLLRLRARNGAAAVPIPGSPAVPAVFAAASLALAGLALAQAGAVLVPAIAVLGSGVVAYVALRRRAPDRTSR